MAHRGTRIRIALPSFLVDSTPYEQIHRNPSHRRFAHRSPPRSLSTQAEPGPSSVLPAESKPPTPPLIEIEWLLGSEPSSSSSKPPAHGLPQLPTLNRQFERTVFMHSSVTNDNPLRKTSPQPEGEASGEPKSTKYFTDLDNTRLAWFGDAILQAVSAEFLYKMSPNQNVGELTVCTLFIHSSVLPFIDEIACSSYSAYDGPAISSLHTGRHSMTCTTRWSRHLRV